MKICVMVQNLYTLGGIQRVITTLLNELVKDSTYNVTVVMPFKMAGDKLFQIDERIILKQQEELAVDRTNKLISYLFALNKRIGFLDHNFFLNYISNNNFEKEERQNYINYFNKEKFDVVIAVGMVCSLLLGEVSDQITAKTIGWQHSTFDSYFERRCARGYGLLKYGKKCYLKLDDIWVLTKADKLEFDKKFGLNCKVLYNPVPKNEKIQSVYESGYILFVGRLEINHKGLDYLIEIMKRVIVNVPTSKLVIVGNGPSYDWLKKQIEKNGLSDVISLIGTTNNVYQFYEKASVMLQTSRWEGFGMTIVEAMSCGVPVVAFHNYGPDEIIRDGEDGYLVERFKVDEFADKVVSILNNQNLCEKLGKNGMLRAKEFSIERLIPVFTKYIQDVMEG